jgi:hypothetical protein
VGDLGTTLQEVYETLDTLADDAESDITQNEAAILASYVATIQAQLDRLKNIVTSRAPS